MSLLAVAGGLTAVTQPAEAAVALNYYVSPTGSDAAPTARTWL
jgi:hypothetical protein